MGPLREMVMKRGCRRGEEIEGNVKMYTTGEGQIHRRAGNMNDQDSSFQILVIQL